MAGVGRARVAGVGRARVAGGRLWLGSGDCFAVGAGCGWWCGLLWPGVNATCCGAGWAPEVAQGRKATHGGSWCT